MAWVGFKVKLTMLHFCEGTMKIDSSSISMWPQRRLHKLHPMEECKFWKVYQRITVSVAWKGGELYRWQRQCRGRCARKVGLPKQMVGTRRRIDLAWMCIEASWWFRLCPHRNPTICWIGMLSLAIYLSWTNKETFLWIAHCVEPTGGLKSGKHAEHVKYQRCILPEWCQVFHPRWSWTWMTMGSGTIPEIKSLWISLSIVIMILAEQQVKEYIHLVCFYCIIDFCCRIACNPVFSDRSCVNSPAICQRWSR
jgi:hypothetical protein